MTKHYPLLLNIPCFVSLFYAGTQNHIGFEYLWLLPATYLLCYNFIIRNALNKVPLTTLHIVNIVMFIRTVFLPFWISIWPLYGFSAYIATEELIRKGCLFICYEVLFVSLFFLFACHFLKKKRETESVAFRSPELKEGYEIYLIAILVAFLVFLFVPSSRASLHFMRLPTGTEMRVSLMENTFGDLFLRQIIVTGLGTLVVVSMLMNYRKNVTPYRMLMMAAPIVLCIGTIVGEMRSVQIYATAGCFFTLTRCYPSKIKMLGWLLGGFAFLVLLFMTLYKSLYAFNSGSYADVLLENDFDPEKISHMLEVYIFGPVCAASVFSFEEFSTFSASLPLFLYDTFRPIMGLNILAKAFDYQLTSELYNLHNTLSGFDTSGLLIPISGQAYLYFGWLLSPVLICCFYLLAIKLELIIKTTHSLFLVFWCSYFFIRISTCMICSNVPSVLTSGSLVFLFTFFFYFLQTLFDSHRANAKETCQDAEKIS